MPITSGMLPLLKKLLSDSRDLAFVIDPKGFLLDASNGAIDRSLLKLMGPPVTGVYWPELFDYPEKIELIFENFRELEPVFIETGLCSPEGEVVSVVLSLQYFSGDEESDSLYLCTGYCMDQQESDVAATLEARLLTCRILDLQQSLSDVNRQLAQTALQLVEEQQKMKAILGSLGQGLLVVNAAGIVEEVGGVAESLLDLTKQTTIGRPISKVMPKLAQLLKDSNSKSPEAGQYSDHITCRDLRFEQGARILRANLSPIVDSENAFHGNVIIFEDYTQISQIDRMKSELISVVSHELRTPLASIKGYLDLVMEGQAGEINSSQQEYLTIVQSNSQRPMEMVDTMLDIARIESGRLQIHKECVELGHLIHYVCSTFRQTAEDKKIQIITTLPEDLMICTDLERMIQVLSNLLSNAVKYTPTGGQIEVRADRGDGEVHIEIQDNGIGISEEDQKRLFEKFFRASGTSSIKGTGLGLAITRSLVEAHGGSIRVKSKSGQGSCFTIALPD